jgi:hypothetical protein
VNVVYAVESGSLITPDGGTVSVRKGTHWSAADPVVQAHPDWFSADARYGLSWSGEPPAEMRDAPVEQATAAPGEKRNVRRG